MFDTIVWATDGSEQADAALGYVVELARIHRSRIVALHVDTRSLEADESSLRSKIEGKVDEMRAAGLDAKVDLVVTRRHNLAAAISDSVAEADLIIVGTHGYGDFEALIRGSVARSLTHEARCPVLVVPPGVRAPSRRELTRAGARPRDRPSPTQVESL